MTQWGNDGQLYRNERVQMCGIDCEDQIVWQDWTPGKESEQLLVLHNVALVTQKIKFKLPKLQEFDMPYPDPFKLAPGMKKSIPICFRPSKYQPYSDKIQIITKGGEFFVTIRAKVKNIAICVDEFVNFGLCATMERSERHVDVYNCGTVKTLLKWHSRKPFTVKTQNMIVDIDQTAHCVVEFEPQEASVFEALLICEALPVNDALATDDETISGSSRQQDFPMEPKRMNIHCVGVGKMPLCVFQINQILLLILAVYTQGSGFRRLLRF